MVVETGAARKPVLDCPPTSGMQLGSYYNGNVISLAKLGTNMDNAPARHIRDKKFASRYTAWK